MERPIAYHLLRKEELVYEVEIRDVKPEFTVEALRVQIRELARTLPADEILDCARDPKVEISTVQTKLDEVEAAVSQDSLTYKVFNRLRAVTHHVFHRLSRIPERGDYAEERDAAQTKLEILLCKIDRRFHVFSTSFEQPAAVTPEVAPTAVPGPSSFTSPVVVQCNNNIDRSISRLNLKFNGLTCVRSFLLRLGELCETRSIADETVLQGAAELFTGPALTWFRSVRTSITSMSALKHLLIEEFSPFDFDDRLLAEIRARTQGAIESITIYIAIMINYFNLLTVPLSETEQIKIIRYNLRPNFVSALALEDITSISDLKRKGKILEYSFFRAASLVEPARPNASTLAPDLAYKGSAPKKVEVVDAEPKFCARCRVNGHSVSSCKSKNIVCFGCGTKGFIRPRCPNCNPKKKELGSSSSKN
jgi:hypothetical protein